MPATPAWPPQSTPRLFVDVELAVGPLRIDGPQAHGIEGLVAMFGIESPGLTSSLAIGEEVADLLGVTGSAPPRG